VPLRFTKMHGLGNDFVVFEAGAGGAGLPTMTRLRELADRHTGIGFDQALAIEPPRAAGAAAFYRIFNADGVEVEQCGNGARCVAEWLRLEGRGGAELALDSPGGRVLARLLRPGWVSVDMGEPDFRPAALPFTASGEAPSYRLPIDGSEVEFAVVSMGNPHAVLFVPSVTDAPVAQLGPRLESHPAFPRRVNVGFLEIVDAAHARLRVYERGVGETLACGTGACAAVAAGRKAGRLAPRVAVTLPGGVLEIAWDGPGAHLWMTGPAAVAFRGEVEA
jgi:diaminopimelate epimerase